MGEALFDIQIMFLSKYRILWIDTYFFLYWLEGGFLRQMKLSTTSDLLLQGGKWKW